jgi:hypothetical protein
MELLVAKTKEALLKTVDLLTTEFRIYSWSFLPYEAIALVLCYVYAHTDRLSPEQTKRVRQWFWRSAFGERYRGASEHFISQDLELIREFVINSNGKPEQFGLPPTDELWSTVVFRSNNSRSRAFILMLALRGPRNLTNAAAIDPSQALSIYNQKEFHHIFPRAYLRASKTPGEHNAIANFCMLAASENRLISDDDPNVYLPKCILNLGENSKSVFESAILPVPSVLNYEKTSFADFLSARAPLLSECALSLCNGDT